MTVTGQGTEPSSSVEPAALPAGQSHHLRSPFVRRVSGIFATRVVQFGLAFMTSILISRLLGPEDKGTFVVVSTLPGMLSVIGVFGLPNAINYFAGRGNSVPSLTRAAFAFTAVLSVFLITIVWVSLPTLESSVLSAVANHDTLARVILVTLPMSILVTFGAAILYGRQDVRVYNFIQIGQAVASLLCAVVLVGVLRLGVAGAVAGSVLVTTLTMVAVMETVRRLGRRDAAGSDARPRELVSYGLRLYPSTVSGFGNARADTYILQALLVNSTRAVGLYATAVTMAELVFYVPDSISSLFLPRVAGSTTEDANRMLGRVARLSTLITVGIAVTLVPVAFIGINLVLPRYVDCLPAFCVLLPAVVSLSLAKIMTSYVVGRGHPGWVSIANVVALVMNVTLNLILIPRFGIVGASLSSLVSYTAHAVMTLAIASRLSRQGPLSLFIPGRAEVALLVSGFVRLGRRLPLLRGA
ncbi:MAG TPA: polysaccharide biosynthesis C-terminal domain-containing protein [Candidatus Limnocylindrales bacterium]